MSHPLIVHDARNALGLYRRACGATILRVTEGLDGRVINALFKIGDSVLLLADQLPLGLIINRPPAALASPFCYGLQT
jgi:uncharacterized glyoxalase superfamily protein PhnB